MKIKQLIKKSISQKTLFTDVFGYSLTKTGFADKDWICRQIPGGSADNV